MTYGLTAKALRASVATLSIIFGSASCALPETSAQTQAPAPQEQKTETIKGVSGLTLDDIMQGPQTKKSQKLKSLEAWANATKPADGPPVLFMDRDQILAWYAIAYSQDLTGASKAIADYVETRTGQRPAGEELDLLLYSFMDSSAYTSLPIPGGARKHCLIFPQSPDRSFASLLAGSFPDAVRDINIPMSTEDFINSSNRHETAHCHATRYNKLINIASQETLDLLLLRNKQEIQAEIFGLLSALQNSAPQRLIQETIDFRLLRIFAYNPLQKDAAQKQKINPLTHVAYFMHPALLEMQRFIDDSGIEEIKKMSAAELREVAYTITDKHALDAVRFRDIALLIGAEHPAAQAAVRDAQNGDQYLTSTLTDLNAALHRRLGGEKAPVPEADMQAIRNNVFPMVLEEALTQGGLEPKHILAGRVALLDKMRAGLATTANRADTEALLIFLQMSPAHVLPMMDAMQQEVAPSPAPAPTTKPGV